MRQYFMLFLIFPMSDVSLSVQVPCTVNLEDGVNYHRITWYKVSDGPSFLVGLVTKDLRSNTTHLYKSANHSYQIGSDLSLLHVPEHNQVECEIYRCSVWPPVGHHILESDYSFPQGCQSSAVEMIKKSSRVESSHVVQHNYYVIIGVGLVLFVAITTAVCICKKRKTHTKVLSHVSI